MPATDHRCATEFRIALPLALALLAGLRGRAAAGPAGDRGHGRPALAASQPAQLPAACADGCQRRRRRRCPVARGAHAPDGRHAAGAAAAPPPPGGPPPFAVVIKDAKQIDGPITAWQKDDKLWLELAPEHFGKPFILSPKLSTGIGEAFIVGGLMAYAVSGAGGPQVVEFVRVHNQVRLQARNLDVIAKPGTPEARAVAVSYSPSLLGSAPVASQPHPQRKTVLIEANGLFLSDMLGVGMQLQRAFRQGYSLDPRNSSDHRGARLAAVAGNPDAEPLLLAAASACRSRARRRACPCPTVPQLRARLAQPVRRPPLLAGAAAGAADGAASRRRAHRADDAVGAGLQRRPGAHAARAHGRTLAPGEEGPAGRAVRAGQADHLLARPQRAAEVPRRRSPKAILEWNKAFEKIGFKDADRRQAAEPTTPSSTRSTWAIRRCAG